MAVQSLSRPLAICLLICDTGLNKNIYRYLNVLQYIHMKNLYRLLPCDCLSVKCKVFPNLWRVVYIQGVTEKAPTEQIALYLIKNRVESPEPFFSMFDKAVIIE